VVSLPLRKASPIWHTEQGRTDSACEADFFAKSELTMRVAGYAILPTRFTLLSGYRPNPQPRSSFNRQAH